MTGALLYLRYMQYSIRRNIRNWKKNIGERARFEVVKVKKMFLSLMRSQKGSSDVINSNRILKVEKKLHTCKLSTRLVKLLNIMIREKSYNIKYTTQKILSLTKITRQTVTD